MLVVSAYVRLTNGMPGYISGACTSPGNCPNEVPPFIHDFGSILNFMEYVFGTGGQPLHFAGQPPNSGISPSYPYADVFAPDGHVVYPPSLYSLSDFFDFNTQRSFTKLPQPIKTACFINPSDPNCFGAGFSPSDPDADNVDLQD